MDQVSSQTNETIHELKKKLTDCVNDLELKFELGDLDPEKTIPVLDEIQSNSYWLWQAIEKDISLEFDDFIVEAIKRVYSVSAGAVDHYKVGNATEYRYTLINEVKTCIDISVKEKEKLD